MLIAVSLASFLSILAPAQKPAGAAASQGRPDYPVIHPRAISKTEVVDALTSWENAAVYRAGGGPLRVNVMPSSFIDPQTGLPQPASWVGRDNLIWGNAQGGTLPYTWSWSFGDGTPADKGVANSGAEARYIYARHQYTTQGPKFATLTVTDDDGNTDSDVVRIDVGVKDIDSQVQSAIEEGLRYLYLIQYPDGYFPVDPEPGGLPALAFQLRGHNKYDDPDHHIYADTVSNYWNYILAQTGRWPISAVGEPGDPEGSAPPNDYGVHFGPFTSGYQQGIMALALSTIHPGGDLNEIVTVGTESGRSIHDVLQDVVDLIAYSQTNFGTQRGGWRYEVLTGSSATGSDNSAVQWPVLGMIAAEDLGITIKPHVKTELQLWTTESQDGTGGFGYTERSYWNNLAKTGSGLIQLAWLGHSFASLEVQAAMGFLNAYWSDYLDVFGYHQHFSGNFYAMYAIKKGMEGFLPDGAIVGTHDWQDEYNKNLVHDPENQYDGVGGTSFDNDYIEQYVVGDDYYDGIWPYDFWFGYYGGYGTQTAAAILILNPGVVRPVPVAECLAYPEEAGPGDLITLDASASFHQNPNLQVVEYLWDFDDGDGTDFAAPDASGVVTTTSFQLPPGETSHTFGVTLRIADNDSPPVQRIHRCDVTISTGVNHAPVALAGGPYSACVGESITLNGSASFDPDEDEGDFVAEYHWDIDGDGQFDDFDGPSTTVTFPGLYDGFVSLQVEDSHGVVSTNSNARVRVFTARGDLSASEGDLVVAGDEGCLAGTVACVSGSYRVESDDPGFVVPAARVDFYLDDPNEPANRFASFTDENLTDGMVVTHTACFTRPDARDHRVVMIVDANQAVNECVETDNRLELELECDCCLDENGKPRALEAVILQYTGDKCASSSHHQDPAQVACSDPLRGPLPDRVIVVVGEKPCGSAGPTGRFAVLPQTHGFTTQIVTRGQKFIVGASEIGRQAFGESTYVCILNPITGKLMQSLKINTSCEQPLFHGDQFGSIRVVDCQGGPLIVSTPELQATSGALYLYEVKARDSVGSDQRLVYSLVNRPPGMSIDPLEGLITWTPSSSQEGSHGVLVRVEDPDGYTDEQGYAIVVAEPRR